MKNFRVEQPGFTVKAIETTGAGDTFCGCSINGVLKYGLDNLDEAKIKRDSDICECRCSTDHNAKKGAIRSMPGTGKYQRTDREIGNYGSTQNAGRMGSEDK